MMSCRLMLACLINSNEMFDEICDSKVLVVLLLSKLLEESEKTFPFTDKWILDSCFYKIELYIQHLIKQKQIEASVGFEVLHLLRISVVLRKFSETHTNLDILAVLNEVFPVLSLQISNQITEMYGAQDQGVLDNLHGSITETRVFFMKVIGTVASHQDFIDSRYNGICSTIKARIKLVFTDLIETIRNTCASSELEQLLNSDYRRHVNIDKAFITTFLKTGNEAEICQLIDIIESRKAPEFKYHGFYAPKARKPTALPQESDDVLGDALSDINVKARGTKK